MLIAVLIAATAGGHATDRRKMSAYVKSAMLQYETSSAASRSSLFTRHSSLLTKRPTLTAFIKADADSIDHLCSNYGCQLHCRYGHIAIVSIPLNAIGQLSDHPAVSRIEAGPTSRVAMDTTAIIVGADKLYHQQTVDGGFAAITPSTPSAPSAPSPFTGQGVVLGIMDIGFDLTHPNFYDATATRYRIGAFWDQLANDTSLHPHLPVGRAIEGYDAVLAQLHSRDGLIQTHGTHTLGIAAGSGYNSPYRGIAYDADLCVVSNAVTDDIALIDSADLYKYTTATDALGFKYIFDYADHQGKPCVASFSEGYTPTFDSEDSLYAAFLDSLTATPGHIIVSAAGNEGYYPTYLYKAPNKSAGAFLDSNSRDGQYRLIANAPITLTLHAYAAAPASTSRSPLSASLPSSPAPLRSISMSWPCCGGAAASADTLITDTLFCLSDTLALTLQSQSSSLKSQTIILEYRASKPLAQLAFRTALTLEPTAAEAELFGSSTHHLQNRAEYPQWSDAQKGHNILAPASFPNVITVGATAHRLGFTNYKGEYKDYSEGRTVGLRAPYSSTGPTITGQIKPEVTAPGDNIISSYSSYYLEAKPDARDINSDVEHFQFHGRTYAWNANAGTSMACPVVAGVIALWLQAKPDLTHQEIRDILSHTCRQPDASLTYPNNDYGYGEIDAYRGLLHILGIDAISDVSLHQPARLRLYVEGNALVITHHPSPITHHLSPITHHPSPITHHPPLTITIYSTAGRVVHTVHHPDIPTTESEQSASAPLTDKTYIPLPALPAGFYAIQVSSADRSLCGSQLIAIP